MCVVVIHGETMQITADFFRLVFGERTGIAQEKHFEYEGGNPGRRAVQLLFIFVAQINSRYNPTQANRIKSNNFTT